MKIQAYCAYQGTLVVTVATPRPEAAASTVFTAASIHEDFAAKVRVALQEWKHVEASAKSFPAAEQLQTYLPTVTIAGEAKPIYALRQLMPAGSPRSIDQDFQLEVFQLRYDFMLVLLPAAFAGDQRLVSGIERNLEKAVHDLFDANDIPSTFIPGNMGIRDEQDNTVPTRSEIDIICEMGPALTQGRTAVDIPNP